MSSDPQLDELAAAGQRRREAEARAAAKAARREQSAENEGWAERRRKADALRTFTTLRSLSAATTVTIVFAILSGFAVLMGGFGALLHAATVGGFPLWIAIVIAACLLPMVVALLWVVHVRRRDIGFRAARRYRVSGYQRSLDYGRSYPSTDFEIEFEGSPPSRAILTDVFATLPVKTRVKEIDGTVVKCEVSGDGSKFDGHRRWLPRWFYPACTEVFDVIHRSHPISELRFPGF